MNKSCPRTVRGFSLLEAMIALLVLSIGLLGLAALQARSMGYNHDALVRSQATALAYDILERMRSRSYASGSGAETVVNTFQNTAGTPYTGTASGATCPPTSADSNTVTNEVTCFRESLGRLPGNTSVQATIQCANATASECTDGDVANNIYAVTVAWVDRRTGAVLATPLTISAQL